MRTYRVLNLNVEEILGKRGILMDDKNNGLSASGYLKTNVKH